jgi:hypothetical protein
MMRCRAALDFTYVDDAVDATGLPPRRQRRRPDDQRRLGADRVGPGGPVHPESVPGPSASCRCLARARRRPGIAAAPASRAAELLGYVPRVSVAPDSRVVQSLTEYQQSSDPPLAEIGADEKRIDV